MAHHHDLDQLVGMSATMVEVLRLIEVCSESDCRTILISGEHGTGKELVARIIHLCSCRRDAPFININCAAMPDHYSEQKSFGDKNGATADNLSLKKGIFGRTDGGTVFLDEVGDIPPFIQRNFFKVLKACSCHRGGERTTPEANVRIIASTSLNLQNLVENGLFYGDLSSYLNNTSISLPPLRERRECIPALVDYFIGRFNIEYGKTVQGFKSATMTCLQQYDWPGNVRELRNAVKHAVMFETSPLLTSTHLPVEVCRRGNIPLQDDAFQIMPEDGVVGNPWIMLPPEGITLEGVEKKLIEQALNRFAGNQTKAARCLGMSRDTIRYRMKKFGLDRGQMGHSAR